MHDHQFNHRIALVFTSIDNLFKNFICRFRNRAQKVKKIRITAPDLAKHRPRLLQIPSSPSPVGLDSASQKLASSADAGPGKRARPVCPDHRESSWSCVFDAS